jgi:hypothetical protein
VNPEVHVAVDQPAGLFGALRGRPLSQDDLAPVPADATIALALRVADGALEGAAVDLVSAVAGDVDRDYGRFRAAVDETAGVRWREDLLAQGQDCAVAWSAPSQGGLAITSAVGVVPLRDGKAFAASFAQMWEKVAERAPNKAAALDKGQRLGYRGYLERFEYRGQSIWWVDLAERDFPFAAAWTHTPQHFVIGLQPQAVRAAIDSSLQPDFDKALVRSPAVSKRGNATVLLHLDLRGLLQQAYGGLLVLFQGATHEWQSEGFDFDLADLPRLQSLLPHLGPELTVVEPLPSGFAITRTGTLPVFDPVLVTLFAALLTTR